MHSAPAVTYPVGPAVILLSLLWALSLAGGGGIVLWSLATAGLGWRQIIAATCWAATAASAFHFWRHRPVGLMRWNGEFWYWDLPVSDIPGHNRVVVDLQIAMLLQWRAHGQHAARAPVVWLWVERGARPLDWAALRRAVYSRAIAAPSP